MFWMHGGHTSRTDSTPCGLIALPSGTLHAFSRSWRTTPTRPELPGQVTAVRQHSDTDAQAVTRTGRGSTAMRISMIFQEPMTSLNPV
jgi:ABC-type dipeptide/oligopeptide/nickel transport system ATPase component